MAHPPTPPQPTPPHPLAPNSTYLPSGEWYEWETFTVHTGPANLTVQNAALTDVPVYVKKGSIIPLAPVVQFTDALPGGPLEVHIYGGADATFTMVEDDGETLSYISDSTKATRATAFTYDDAKKKLSYAVSGTFKNENTFTQFKAVLFADGKKQESKVFALSQTGEISF